MSLAVGLLAGEALRPRRWPWRAAGLGGRPCRSIGPAEGPTGSVEGLTGSAEGLTGPVEGLTGSAEGLTGPVEGLTGPARGRPSPDRRRSRDGRLGRSDLLSGAALAEQVDCLDLLALSLSSGAVIAQAVLDVAAVQGAGGPLSSAAGRLQRGTGLLDVLDDLPGALGDEWQALATTLAVAASSGAPALEAVGRLGAAQRLRLRRLSEQRIRRLPVLLLFPLVLLSLPAFVLVTFVPALVSIGGAVAG